MLPEWPMIKQTALQGLITSQKALETCDHSQIEMYRGRISAFRAILKLGEEPQMVQTEAAVPSFL